MGGGREEDSNFHTLDLFRNEEEGRVSTFSDSDVLFATQGHLRTERKEEKKRTQKQLDEKEIQLEWTAE